jgi:hypothetical protein
MSQPCNWGTYGIRGLTQIPKMRYEDHNEICFRWMAKVGWSDGLDDCVLVGHSSPRRGSGLASFARP